MKKINLEICEKILYWRSLNDIGISSDTILFAITGKSLYSSSRDTPKDVQDFGRCYRLLEAIPELKSYLYLVGETYPNWIPIIREWHVLAKMYKGNRTNFYQTISKLNQEGEKNDS